MKMTYFKGVDTVIYDNYKSNEFFASSNTGGGFFNKFDEIFSGLKKKYIIKGGPGTGKSRLMRDLASAAERSGHRVEYFYCSSDPDSLDGILIDSSVGMVDGTPPHISEPDYPGAVGEIINLGDFWNRAVLENRTEEIIKLSDEKAKLFAGAYRYLSSVRQLEGYISSVIASAVNREKLESCVKRIIGKSRGRDGIITVRQTESYSMKGFVLLPAFEKASKTSYLVTGKYNTAHIFFGYLLREAERNKLSAVVSYSSSDPGLLSGIYLPETGCAFVTGEGRQSDRIINMERFINNDEIRRYRQRIRFAKKCSSAMAKGAEKCFDEIKNVHFRLEEIYSSAMDFSRKEEFQTALIERIISEL